MAEAVTAGWKSSWAGVESLWCCRDHLGSIPNESPEAILGQKSRRTGTSMHSTSESFL